MLSADQTEFAQPLLVGMADFLVVHNQNAILRTTPLGACLGVSIFDPAAKSRRNIAQICCRTPALTRRAPLRDRECSWTPAWRRCLCGPEELGARLENLW